MNETMREKENSMRENEIIMREALFCVTFWLWKKVDGAKDDGYQTR